MGTVLTSEPRSDSKPPEKGPLAGKKFLVVGGYVVNRKTGARRYVSSTDLLNFYSVRREQCVLIESYSPLSRLKLKIPGIENLHILAPKPDGAYRKPKV